jgi:hypothetical protein
MAVVLYRLGNNDKKKSVFCLHWLNSQIQNPQMQVQSCLFFLERTRGTVGRHSEICNLEHHITDLLRVNYLSYKND